MLLTLISSKSYLCWPRQQQSQTGYKNRGKGQNQCDPNYPLVNICIKKTYSYSDVDDVKCCNIPMVNGQIAYLVLYV